MEYITGLLSNSGFIMYNKTIAKELGITEAVLLGEFCAKYQYWLENGALIQNDGWFFVTRDDILLDTGLTDNQQRSALQTLKDSGIVEVKRKGVPSKMWYRLIVEVLHDLLSKKYTTSGLKSRPLDIGKVDDITKKEITNKETKKEYAPLPHIENSKILFDQFWNAYPKKSAKGEAQKAFARLKVSQELLALMLEAIKFQLQSAQWKRDSGQYIPHPATWLNQRRWEDEQGEVKVNGKLGNYL